jgi:hypothetical protein
MNKDVIPEPSDNDILTALTYCGVSDGDLCGMCWYSRFTGGMCRKTLTHDAVARMKELLEENERLKEECV